MFTVTSQISTVRWKWPCIVLAAASFFIVCLFTSISSAEPVRWEIAAGGNGHLYDVVLVGTAMTWDDARTRAQAIGSGWDLATITSAEESAFVKNLFNNDPSFFIPTTSCVGSNCTGPWIGGFSVFGTNNFQWVTGEAVTFTDWGPSEPFGNGDAITYADFSSPFGDGSGIAWNDFPASMQQRPDNPIAYVAEIVPEPSTAFLMGLGLAWFSLRRRGACAQGFVEEPTAPCAGLPRPKVSRIQEIVARHQETVGN